MVTFGSENFTFTDDGRLYDEEEISLRLTGRPFEVGDRVVIGGEKGIVHCNSHQNTKTPVSVLVGGKEHVYITTDGRAWPGTPIIAEHDWEEESEIGNKEQEKEALDVSPGFAKDWPIDNGIEDVTVSDAEVWHIAGMQEIEAKNISLEIDGNEINNIGGPAFEKIHNYETPKYIKMALAMEGIEVDLKTADLIREIIHAVYEIGGSYSIYNSCSIRQKIEEKYAV